MKLAGAQAEDRGAILQNLLGLDAVKYVGVEPVSDWTAGHKWLRKEVCGERENLFSWKK